MEAHRQLFDPRCSIIILVVFPGTIDVFLYVFVRFEWITYCNMFKSRKTSKKQASFPGNVVIFLTLGKHQEFKHCFLEPLSLFCEKKFMGAFKKKFIGAFGVNRWGGWVGRWVGGERRGGVGWGGGGRRPP